MNYFQRALLAIVFYCCFALSASAEEIIERFVSAAQLERDGTLLVTEDISVIAEGKQIRRGIYRDFPVTYERTDGTKVKVGFDVERVLRNGAPEDYSIENIGNAKRVRIGNADRLLSPGIHSFTIRYRTNRQIGFFEDHDELFWNVTGNDWNFPIRETLYNLRLPADAKVKASEAYTGLRGERGKDAEIENISPNEVRVIASRPLRQSEGLSVVVSWQKGVVLPPSEAQQRAWWIRDNLGFGILGLTLLAALAYYVLAWLRVGRDPAKGVIFPQFHPPEGLGPAGVRYVWKRNHDDKGFAAALVGLAVKGRLKISDSDDAYEIVRQEASTNLPLTRSETALYRALPVTPVEMETSSRGELSAMSVALTKALDDEYDGVMFVENFRWFVGGAIFSLLGLLAAAFLLPDGEGFVALFPLFFLSVWWGVILAVGWGAVRGVIVGPGLWTRLASLMSALFLVPFVGAGTFIPYMMFQEMEISPAIKAFIALALAILFINFLFFWWLKAPTPHGRKVMDHIEGFRMYLTTAEEDRLNKLNPPEKTPALFERYLPYAMALDCENEWNAKFARILAAATAAGAAATPIWYNGTGWGSRNFGTSFGSGLASAVATATAPPPGSSSGFSGGGGGGSGGGGGGGGGGGW